MRATHAALTVLGFESMSRDGAKAQRTGYEVPMDRVHESYLAWLFFILIEMKHIVAKCMVADLTQGKFDVYHASMGAMKLHLGATV